MLYTLLEFCTNVKRFMKDSGTSPITAFKSVLHGQTSDFLRQFRKSIETLNDLVTMELAKRND